MHYIGYIIVELSIKSQIQLFWSIIIVNITITPVRQHYFQAAPRRATTPLTQHLDPYINTENPTLVPLHPTRRPSLSATSRSTSFSVDDPLLPGRRFLHSEFICFGVWSWATAEAPHQMTFMDGGARHTFSPSTLRRRSGVKICRCAPWVILLPMNGTEIVTWMEEIDVNTRWT